MVLLQKRGEFMVIRSIETGQGDMRPIGPFLKDDLAIFQGPVHRFLKHFKPGNRLCARPEHFGFVGIREESESLEEDLKAWKFNLFEGFANLDERLFGQFSEVAQCQMVIFRGDDLDATPLGRHVEQHFGRF